MNIFRKLGTIPKEWTVGIWSVLGKIKLLVTEGAADKTLTLTNAALTDNRTITFPDATGTVALTSGNHTQNTDTGTTGNTFTIDSDSATGKIVVDVALGAADKALTLTNAALTDNRTITFPDATGTVALTSGGHTQNTDTGTTGATFTVDSDSATGKIAITAAAGAANKTLTLTNAALTDNRTITLPDSTGTVALTSDIPASTGVTGTTFTVDSDSETGKIAVVAAAGAANKTLTLTNAALTDNRTITLPDATGTVMLVPTPQTEMTDELTTVTHEAASSADYAIAAPVQNTGFGFSTSDEMNTVLAVIANLQTRQNELETKLVALGLLADAD